MAPTAEELKERQKKMQQLVRKLRAEGKTDKEIKKAKHQLKRSFNGHNKPGKHPLRERGKDGMRLDKRNRKAGTSNARWNQAAGRGGGYELTEAQRAAEQREELGKKHDLVIIPIFWKRNVGEKENIIDACNELKEKLIAYRLNVWIDQRTKYTPGQKYAYWEHLGVLVRIEMGPKELKSHTCIVGRCSEAGTVAKRWQNVDTSDEKLKDLVDILKKKCELPVRNPKKCGNGSENEVDQREEGEGEREREAGREGEGEGKEEGKGKGSVVASGDSLEVNYVLDDPNEKKKKRKRVKEVNVTYGKPKRKKW